MGSLSRLSKKCRECPFKEKCSKKRMEAEGYLPDPMLASATMPSTEELAAPILRKHDYRDVKVAERAGRKGKRGRKAISECERSMIMIQASVAAYQAWLIRTLQEQEDSEQEDSEQEDSEQEDSED